MAARDSASQSEDKSSRNHSVDAAAADTTASTTGPIPTRPVHILFVGAGAVGCFYASRLHHPSHNIHTSLTARSNYTAISTSGVSLQTRTFGDYTFHPHAVYPSVSAAATDGNIKIWDYIIVTTKALPDLTDDSALIAPLITSPTTCIVLIQNGVGVEAPYRARFPHNPIVSAVTVISAEQISSGVIRQNRWTRISLGPYIYGLGPKPSSSSSLQNEKGKGEEEKDLTSRGLLCMTQLTHWWTSLGGIKDVDAHPSELSLQTIRWHKLCINAAFNPTSVLSGGRGNADQLTSPELRAHVIGVMREIWDAAPKVLGGEGFTDKKLATIDKLITSTERNAGARPSMLLDWEAGRPMELEVILGNPVRIARAVGVEMPRLQSMYALLKSMQQTREANTAAARERKEKL